MTIQEAQEQIKNTSFVENPDIFHKQSFKDRADTLALFTIIEAIQSGYQLCKVDEVIEKTQHLAKNIHSDCANACAYEFGQILEEACK